MNYIVWKEWLGKGGFPCTMPDLRDLGISVNVEKAIEHAIETFR